VTFYYVSNLDIDKTIPKSKRMGGGGDMEKKTAKVVGLVKRSSKTMGMRQGGSRVKRGQPEGVAEEILNGKNQRDSSLQVRPWGEGQTGRGLNLNKNTNLERGERLKKKVGNRKEEKKQGKGKRGEYL